MLCSGDALDSRCLNHITRPLWQHQVCHAIRLDYHAPQGITHQYSRTQLQEESYPDFLDVLCGDCVYPDHVLGEILHSDEGLCTRCAKVCSAQGWADDFISSHVFT